jgi:hypothetical protein
MKQRSDRDLESSSSRVLVSCCSLIIEARVKSARLPIARAEKMQLTNDK